MNIIQENTDKVLLDLIIYTNKLYQDRSDLLKNISDINDISKICKTQIDKELNLYMLKNYPHIKLVYSFMGLRFDYVYPKKPKKLYNGSNPETHFRLYQAIKYQYISNYENVNSNPGLISIISYKLLKNINNSITFNINGQIIYNPITADIIKKIIIQVKQDIANENYEVIDINGVKHILDIKYKYEKMKRFTKDEFIEIIKQTEEILQKTKPTPAELTLFINNRPEYFKENRISDTLTRKYISMFDLQDMVTIKKRRTKMEMKMLKNI